MDKDYTELIEYLGDKFEKVDNRFDKIDERIDKIDEKINKIGTTLENKADKKDVQDLVNAIDRLTKSIETYREEQIALSFKVDKMEKWIQQIADKVGIKLVF
ncbi:MAG TPA: hypothetical protein VMW82_02540 [Candidatus Paceibacterota bacterium]|nr:hypothetical protein [Candidatus Paceibacterota bacterium]